MALVGVELKTLGSCVLTSLTTIKRSICLIDDGASRRRNRNVRFRARRADHSMALVGVELETLVFEPENAQLAQSSLEIRS